MTAADSRTTEHTGIAARWALMTMCVLAFTVAMASVLVTPLVLGRLYAKSDDYSRLSDIEQSYGAASALIAVMDKADELVGFLGCFGKM
ncbi:hypothetical protein [Paractinoplanes atraurantiacus]|uniref:Uncharacterized protein n=1 Tax=Paractinoplanes atraurantiacus TaxID=1036182 RepID=A0A285IXV0_9ACTN|nr:hypothetical protein [Actinoplanes atraurantiacus]SNY52778.1 hypothetical protein SAMN05421748_11394 [Actinoplanes atraurantiacus]